MKQVVVSTLVLIVAASCSQDEKNNELSNLDDDLNSFQPVQSAEMFSDSDAQPANCDRGVLVTLGKQAGNKMIEVENIVRNPSECAVLLLDFVEEPRPYQVRSETNAKGTIKYENLPRPQEQQRVVLHDYENSSEPRPSDAVWTFSEGQSSYQSSSIKKLGEWDEQEESTVKNLRCETPGSRNYVHQFTLLGKKETLGLQREGKGPWSAFPYGLEREEFDDHMQIRENSPPPPQWGSEGCFEFFTAVTFTLEKDSDDASVYVGTLQSMPSFHHNPHERCNDAPPPPEAGPAQANPAPIKVSCKLL